MPTDASPQINATRVRQGRRGRHVLIVLLISTVLAAIALFTAWGMHSDDFARGDAKMTPSQAETGQRPADQIAPKTPQTPNG